MIYIRHLLENFHWRGTGRGSACGLRNTGLPDPVGFGSQLDEILRLIRKCTK